MGIHVKIQEFLVFTCGVGWKGYMWWIEVIFLHLLIFIFLFALWINSTEAAKWQFKNRNVLVSVPVHLNLTGFICLWWDQQFISKKISIELDSFNLPAPLLQTFGWKCTCCFSVTINGLIWCSDSCVAHLSKVEVLSHSTISLKQIYGDLRDS